MRRTCPPLNAYASGEGNVLIHVNGAASVVLHPSGVACPLPTNILVAHRDCPVLMPRGLTHLSPPQKKPRK